MIPYLPSFQNEWTQVHFGACPAHVGFDIGSVTHRPCDLGQTCFRKVSCLSPYANANICFHTDSSIAFDCLWSRKKQLTGDDFGFKIEEKSWLPSFNTGEAPLWTAMCVQGGQKGQDPCLTKLTSSERRADLTETKDHL